MEKNEAEEKWLITIAERLLCTRRKKGWTLEQAEENGSIDWRHIQRLETQGLNMNLLTLYRIAKLYGVHPSDLLKEI